MKKKLLWLLGICTMLNLYIKSKLKDNNIEIEHKLVSVKKTKII